MYRLYICLFAALLVLTVQPLAATEGAQTLSKPYLDQNPPGKRPEVFAPGIVSLTDNTEFSCTISPKGDEFYFARKRPDKNYQTIMVSFLRNGRWTNPVPAPFNSGMGDFGPMLSPDGDRLYFMSWRQNSYKSQAGPDLYYVEKKGSTWSEPRHLDQPFNPGKSLFVSMSNNNTIYTTDAERSDIVCVRQSEDKSKQSKYENLGSKINGDGLDCYPFVAPDESYLIFTSMRRGFSRAPCLFIAYKLADGNWSNPKFLDTGIENSAMPYVSPDGRYLFFSAEKDIYWMDASIIDDLRPHN